MADQFVGCMVSIDCGEVLGIYQGLLDVVDSSKQTLTIVCAFRNGTKCSVPRITINASDILGLRIIKDAAEAKNHMAVVNKHVKPLSDASASNPVSGTPENGKRASPLPCNGSSVSFHRSPSDLEPTVAAGDGTVAAMSVSHDSLKSSTHTKPSHSSESVVNGGKSRKTNGFTSISPCKLNSYSRNCNNACGNRMRSAGGLPKSNMSDVALNHCCGGVISDGSLVQNGVAHATKMNGPSTASDSNNRNQAFRKRTNSASELYAVVRNGMWKGVAVPTHRQDRHSARGGHGAVREVDDCFAVPVDSFAEDEFDFEKNLALFDKRAVFSQIDREQSNGFGPSAATAVVGASSNASPRPCDMKYRCDENVLPVQKAVYRQILVDKVEDAMTSESSVVKEYVTDSGLVVPCVAPELRSRLFELAESAGCDRKCRIEMVGRSAAEMVLLLLGGGNRFDPKNMHQRPRVTILCGSSGSGSSFAISCARYLAGRGICLTVFIPESVASDADVAAEMKLLNLCDGVVKTSNINDMPTKPVDMIVSAVDGIDSAVVSSRSPWYASVIEWANANKAPVLALDPPSGRVGISSKYSLAVALPLPFDKNCGQIYLCDIGIPSRIFTDAGISKYQSPFAHKFVIPLHTV